jgi:hypothetical protein
MRHSSDSSSRYYPTSSAPRADEKPATSSVPVSAVRSQGLFLSAAEPSADASHKYALQANDFSSRPERV